MYKMYIDGGARGNPGPAGIGIVIYKNNKVIKELYYYIGRNTNNIAEYSALVVGLYYIEKYKLYPIDIYSDSLLLVNQINKVYKIKNIKLLSYYNEVMKYKELFNIYHVRREENKFADELANQGMDLYLKGYDPMTLNDISKQL